MASTWLLLLLALGCPALPTETTAVLRQAQQGVGRTPFPSLAPPITLLVDGKQQTLVVCLVLDVASPGLESPIWFSAGNGSALDAFTYGPSPAADGTWTSLAQLSLSSEELASWETLVCHTGPGMGHHSQSTQPLQLSAGDTSSARTCLWEPLRGTLGQALRLGALRLLLFKVLLFDVLLTYSRLRAPLATRGYPAGETRQRTRSLRGLESPPPPPTGVAAVRGASKAKQGLKWSVPLALQPRARRGAHTRPRSPDTSRSPVWEEGTLPTLPAWASCAGPALGIRPHALEDLYVTCLLPQAGASWGLGCFSPPTEVLRREKAESFQSDWEPLEGGD